MQLEALGTTTYSQREASPHATVVEPPTRPPGLYFPHVLNRLGRRAELAGLRLDVGQPASPTAIAAAAARLGVSFPPEVATIYSHADGLTIEDPDLEVLPIERLAFVAPNRLHFATAGGRHRLCFDTSALNAAGQWTVVAAESGYEVTQSLGSFWSNKIWKWLDQRRAFWTPWPWEAEP
jgi:hypothetical protein